MEPLDELEKDGLCATMWQTVRIYPFYWNEIRVYETDVRSSEMGSP